MKVFRSCFLIILVIGCFVTADENPAGVNSISENTKTVNELKVRLALDEVQTERIKSIFESSESQQKIDTELFRTSAPALIRAAWRRREIIDKKILEIPNDEQLQFYEKFIREREKDEELFRLKHGLLLSDGQSIQAELIISEYSERIKELYSRLEYFVKSGEDRKMKSTRGSDLLANRSKGLEGRNPQMERSRMTPLEKIREFNIEKSKRFRVFLSDEQKGLLPGYDKFQDQELEWVVRNLRK